MFSSLPLFSSLPASRRPVYAAALLLPLVALALLTAGGSKARDASEPDGTDPRIARGFALAPVPLNLHRKDVALVGLGSYLVNGVGGCNDCHTQPSYAPGGDPFRGQPEKINTANYLAGGQHFGPFVSRNLTPEANGLPAGLTYAQFSLEMRTGYDLDQAHPAMGPLLQVMPWPTYSKMTGLDLRAIYEYLRAIPPAPAGS